jgi:hypothetical protein
MLEWRDVIDLVVQALGTDAQSSVVLLEFLTVLPEEVMEGRKISLSVSTSELHHHTRLYLDRTDPANRRMSYRTGHRSY